MTVRSGTRAGTNNAGTRSAQEVARLTGLAIPRAGEPLPLRQHWSASLPREAGWALLHPRADGLACYAWFVDSDPFNAAQENNEFLFGKGDVAEFFLRPGADPVGPYFEFHVSPNNLSLSLRFPHPPVSKRTREEVVACLFVPAGLQWQATIGCGCWGAQLTVPWPVFGLAGRPATGTRWLHSVSRYNYTRPDPVPEYSATAPLAALDYHLVRDYLPLVF